MAACQKPTCRYKDFNTCTNDENISAFCKPKPDIDVNNGINQEALARCGHSILASTDQEATCQGVGECIYTNDSCVSGSWGPTCRLKTGLIMSDNHLKQDCEKDMDNTIITDDYKEKLCFERKFCKWDYPNVYNQGKLFNKTCLFDPTIENVVEQRCNTSHDAAYSFTSNEKINYLRYNQNIDNTIFNCSKEYCDYNSAYVDVDIGNDAWDRCGALSTAEICAENSECIWKELSGACNVDGAPAMGGPFREEECTGEGGTWDAAGDSSYCMPINMKYGVCTGDDNEECDDKNKEQCMLLNECIWKPNHEEYCGSKRYIEKELINNNQNNIEDLKLLDSGGNLMGSIDNYCFSINNPSEVNCAKWGCVWDIYGNRNNEIDYDHNTSGICVPPIDINCSNNYCNRNSNKSNFKEYFPDGMCIADITNDTCIASTNEYNTIVPEFSPGLMGLPGHSSNNLRKIGTIKNEVTNTIENIRGSDNNQKRNKAKKLVNKIFQKSCENQSTVFNNSIHFNEYDFDSKVCLINGQNGSLENKCQNIIYTHPDLINTNGIFTHSCTNKYIPKQEIKVNDGDICKNIEGICDFNGCQERTGLPGEALVGEIKFSEIRNDIVMDLTFITPSSFYENDIIELMDNSGECKYKGKYKILSINTNEDKKSLKLSSLNGLKESPQPYGEFLKGFLNQEIIINDVEQINNCKIKRENQCTGFPIVNICDENKKCYKNIKEIKEELKCNNKYGQILQSIKNKLIPIINSLGISEYLLIPFIDFPQKSVIKSTHIRIVYQQIKEYAKTATSEPWISMFFDCNNEICLSKLEEDMKQLNNYYKDKKGHYEEYMNELSHLFIKFVKYYDPASSKYNKNLIISNEGNNINFSNGGVCRGISGFGEGVGVYTEEDCIRLQKCGKKFNEKCEWYPQYNIKVENEQEIPYISSGKKYFFDNNDGICPLKNNFHEIININYDNQNSIVNIYENPNRGMCIEAQKIDIPIKDQEISWGVEDRCGENLPEITSICQNQSTEALCMENNTLCEWNISTSTPSCIAKTCPADYCSKYCNDITLELTIVPSNLDFCTLSPATCTGTPTDASTYADGCVAAFAAEAECPVGCDYIEPECPWPEGDITSSAADRANPLFTAFVNEKNNYGILFTNKVNENCNLLNGENQKMFMFDAERDGENVKIKVKPGGSTIYTVDDITTKCDYNFIKLNDKKLYSDKYEKCGFCENMNDIQYKNECDFTSNVSIPKLGYCISGKYKKRIIDPQIMNSPLVPLPQWRSAEDGGMDANERLEDGYYFLQPREGLVGEDDVIQFMIYQRKILDHDGNAIEQSNWDDAIATAAYDIFKGECNQITWGINDNNKYRIWTKEKDIGSQPSSELNNCKLIESKNNLLSTPYQKRPVESIDTIVGLCPLPEQGKEYVPKGTCFPILGQDSSGCNSKASDECYLDPLCYFKENDETMCYQDQEGQVNVNENNTCEMNMYLYDNEEIKQKMCEEKENCMYTHIKIEDNNTIKCKYSHMINRDEVEALGTISPESTAGSNELTNTILNESGPDGNWAPLGGGDLSLGDLIFIYQENDLNLQNYSNSNKGVIYSYSDDESGQPRWVQYKSINELLDIVIHLENGPTIWPREPAAGSGPLNQRFKIIKSEHQSSEVQEMWKITNISEKFMKGCIMKNDIVWPLLMDGSEPSSCSEYKGLDEGLCPIAADGNDFGCQKDEGNNKCSSICTTLDYEKCTNGTFDKCTPILSDYNERCIPKYNHIKYDSSQLDANSQEFDIKNETSETVCKYDIENNIFSNINTISELSSKYFNDVLPYLPGGKDGVLLNDYSLHFDNTHGIMEHKVKDILYKKGNAIIALNKVQVIPGSIPPRTKIPFDLSLSDNALSNMNTIRFVEIDGKKNDFSLKLNHDYNIKKIYEEKYLGDKLLIEIEDVSIGDIKNKVYGDNKIYKLSLSEDATEDNIDYEVEEINYLNLKLEVIFDKSIDHIYNVGDIINIDKGGTNTFSTNFNNQLQLIKPNSNINYSKIISVEKNRMVVNNINREKSGNFTNFNDIPTTKKCIDIYSLGGLISDNDPNSFKNMYIDISWEKEGSCNKQYYTKKSCENNEGIWDPNEALSENHKLPIWTQSRTYKALGQNYYNLGLETLPNYKLYNPHKNIDIDNDVCLYKSKSECRGRCNSVEIPISRCEVKEKYQSRDNTFCGSASSESATQCEERHRVGDGPPRCIRNIYAQAIPQCTGTATEISAECTGTAAAPASECTGTATEITAECTGTATEITAECTGTASALAASCTGPATDTEASCTGTASATGASCTGTASALAASCTGTATEIAAIEYPICDLLPGTPSGFLDDDAACPAGCTNTPTATCTGTASAMCTGTATASGSRCDIAAYQDAAAVLMQSTECENNNQCQAMTDCMRDIWDRGMWPDTFPLLDSPIAIACPGDWDSCMNDTADLGCNSIFTGAIQTVCTASGCSYSQPGDTPCQINDAHGTAACPAGCTYTPVGCTGTADEVMASTPTCDLLPETPSGQSDGDAACPAGCTDTAASTPTCDLNAATDGTAACPAGCTETTASTPTCDLNAATDGTAACPAGCTDTAASTPTCDLDAATDSTAACPAGCSFSMVVDESSAIDNCIVDNSVCNFETNSDQCESVLDNQTGENICRFSDKTSFETCLIKQNVEESIYSKNINHCPKNSLEMDYNPKSTVDEGIIIIQQITDYDINLLLENQKKWIDIEKEYQKSILTQTNEDPMNEKINSLNHLFTETVDARKLFLNRMDQDIFDSQEFGRLIENIKDASSALDTGESDDTTLLDSLNSARNALAVKRAEIITSMKVTSTYNLFPNLYNIYPFLLNVYDNDNNNYKGGELLFNIINEDTFNNWFIEYLYLDNGTIRKAVGKIETHYLIEQPSILLSETDISRNKKIQYYNKLYIVSLEKKENDIISKQTGTIIPLKLKQSVEGIDLREEKILQIKKYNRKYVRDIISNDEEIVISSIEPRLETEEIINNINECNNLNKEYSEPKCTINTTLECNSENPCLDQSHTCINGICSYIIDNNDICQNTGYLFDKDTNICKKSINNVHQYCHDKTGETIPSTQMDMQLYMLNSACKYNPDTRQLLSMDRKDCLSLDQQICNTYNGCEYYPNIMEPIIYGDDNSSILKTECSVRSNIGDTCDSNETFDTCSAEKCEWKCPLLNEIIPPGYLVTNNQGEDFDFYPDEYYFPSDITVTCDTTNGWSKDPSGIEKTECILNEDDSIHTTKLVFTGCKPSLKCGGNNFGSDVIMNKLLLDGLDIRDVPNEFITAGIIDETKIPDDNGNFQCSAPRILRPNSSDIDASGDKWSEETCCHIMGLCSMNDGGIGDIICPSGQEIKKTYYSDDPNLYPILPTSDTTGTWPPPTESIEVRSVENCCESIEIPTATLEFDGDYSELIITDDSEEKIEFERKFKIDLINLLKSSDEIEEYKKVQLNVSMIDILNIKDGSIKVTFQINKAADGSTLLAEQIRRTIHGSTTFPTIALRTKRDIDVTNEQLIQEEEDTSLIKFPMAIKFPIFGTIIYKTFGELLGAIFVFIMSLVFTGILAKAIT